VRLHEELTAEQTCYGKNGNCALAPFACDLPRAPTEYDDSGHAVCQVTRRSLLDVIVPLNYLKANDSVRTRHSRLRWLQNMGCSGTLPQTAETHFGVRRGAKRRLHENKVNILVAK
jgi:hypothetical protein